MTIIGILSQSGTHFKKLLPHSLRKPRAFRNLLNPAPLLPVAVLLIAVAALVPIASAAQTVDADPLSRDPQVQQAFQLYYNMDYDAALVRFEKIQSEHPGNPLATAFVLHDILFRELNRLDLLDTTFYANDGFLTGKHTVVQDPKVTAQIKALSQQVYDEADAELKKNPNSINALFARGWTRSLEATYFAMVQRSFGAALHLALGAKDDHQRVLQLDPNYVDAKMVVGIYKYVVGALPWGFKLLIGVAGIHGSKPAGMALLSQAATQGVITSVEARTAMDLFLRREARYQQAIAMNRTLCAQYPHNFLFALERANLSKDAGQGLTAVNLYREAIRDAALPGYFHNAHVELAWFGLGDSLRGQHDYQAAVYAYQNGAFLPSTSSELKRRCLLAAGEAYDLMNQHDKAESEYRNVLDNGSDTVQGELARKYLRDPYTGR